MPTDNISRPLHEELQLLSNALEGDTFHFAVVQWGHFSLIQQAENWLRRQYPERPALSLRVKGLDYEPLIDHIYQHRKGLVFIEDFENLLDDPDLYVAFNQRRGKLARLPLALVCFIPPGASFVEKCIKRLPDWWSVLTFLAELPADQSPEERPSFPRETMHGVSTLGGPVQQDRLDEIHQLQERLNQLDISPANAGLLNSLYQQLLELCQTAALYQTGLDLANHWFEAALELDYEKNDPDSFSFILDRIGTFEKHLGHYERAARLMERALEIALNQYGPDHPNVALRQSNLAIAYRNLGQYERARLLLEVALSSSEKVFGPDSVSVSMIQSNLGNVYDSLGQFEMARYLLETALNSAVKNLGPDHPDVATSQSNLANTYRNLGQYDRARDLLEAALASDLKNFGPDHPNVARNQSNLANVYQNMGQPELARDLLNAALASAVKNFGPDHPNVALRQSNLANVYRNIGQYDRARDLLEAALASNIKNFGPDHPNVAVCQLNLGTVFLNLGEKEKARDQFVQAHRLFLKQLGEQHPNTQTAKEWLDSVA